MTLRYEHVAILWEDGSARLRDIEAPAERAATERAVDAVVAALQRRVGGRFTSRELADLYLRDGIDWTFDLARAAAPGEPAAWDVAIVANAAFARLVRRASDVGGGRRYAGDEE